MSNVSLELMLFESAIYFYKGHTNFIVMLGRGDLSLLLLLFWLEIMACALNRAIPEIILLCDQICRLHETISQ